MALTLQEIIAKRQSMGPNATNVEARQALMATPAVNPAPTTPIVPTPIPTQAPVMDQMAGKTVAERQAIRSGQPAPVTTTPPPTTQTTPQVETPAPVTPQVQPTPVEVKAPVKPVTPTKTEAPIDYTQAQGREQEITNNVKGFIDSGMTPDQAKQASGYNEASPEKKAIIDGIITGASQGALLNEKDALNALISGVSVPKQNTQAFRNAEFKANKFRKFNSMTPTQLLDNLKMGEIGSEMDQLLSQNPNYAQAKQKLNELQKITNLNKTMSNLVTGAKGTEVPTITPEQDEEDISAKLMKKFGLDDANASAFAEFIATDEEMAENKAKLLVNKNQLSNVNRQIADATTLLNQGIKDLKSQYPDMSASGIITLMGSRLGEFNDAITNLNSTKTLLQADIKDEMDLAKSAYDAKSADIQAQNQIKSTMALNEYKSDFEKQQAEQALNDPATAIKSVMDEMAKIGVSSTESLQTKIQKANEFIANGGTIGGYIDEMKKLYTEKPEYKAYLQKQGGTEWQSTNITRYNPATGANESTPVFYRKKTDGSFEAVDLSGNKIDASLIGNGGFNTGTDTPGTIPTSFSGDTTSYIASKEGFRDTAYQDSAGVWTIGYGTTKINGKPIQPGQKITQADAQKQLGADIAKHSNWKNYIDEATLSPSQRTALASFEYNLGPGIWDKGAVNIINMVKSGDLSGAGKEMQKYVNAGGKVIKGLQNRRAEEARLLQSTGTSTTPTQTYDPNKIKSFEAFNGTAFPSDYKTPAQQKQFREEYDAWRASRPGTRIESGNDILNIKIDKPTEGQSASQSYTSRMLNAVNNLMPLEKKFLELGTGGQVAQTYLPALLKSSDQKMMDAEKKNFITAVLRKQSGASIAPSEFAGEEMKYFPQPGDSKDVVIAKQNARNAEIKAMLATAGVDAEGNSLSKYYNPPVITNETATTTTPVKTDKITTLKKNYFN